MTQYTFDPKDTMNSAIDEAYNARVYRMLDEASTTGKAAREYAASRGVVSTLTDADAAAGLTMKMDGDGNGGYNGAINFEVIGTGKTKYDDIEFDLLSEQEKAVIVADI